MLIYLHVEEDVVLVFCKQHLLYMTITHKGNKMQNPKHTPNYINIYNFIDMLEAISHFPASMLSTALTFRDGKKLEALKIIDPDKTFAQEKLELASKFQYYCQLRPLIVKGSEYAEKALKYHHIAQPIPEENEEYAVALYPSRPLSLVDYKSHDKEATYKADQHAATLRTMPIVPVDQRTPEGAKECNINLPEQLESALAALGLPTEFTYASQECFYTENGALVCFESCAGLNEYVSSMTQHLV